MKRALFLTYYIPPRPAIASVRAGQIISSLMRHDWEVVPVVPDFGDLPIDSPARRTPVFDFRSPVVRLLGVQGQQTTHQRFGAEEGVIEENLTLKHRAIRFGYFITNFANSRFGWLGPGSRAVRKMLDREHFDAIISTAPPATTHLVAARVHGNIPWIADLRDPWLRNDGASGVGALVAIDRALEPRAFRTAAAITTVSEPLAEQLRERYPGKRVYSIPNAFSSAEWTGVPFTEPERTTFLYAGHLYGGKRDPRPFFEAVAYLLRERLIHPDEIQVDFYGHPTPWLETHIAQFGLKRVVRLHGFRTRSEIMRLERAASRLLLFLWDGPNERGTYTGKLFEYFGAGRKILAIGGPAESVVDDALMHTGAGEREWLQRPLRDAILNAVAEHRSGNTAIVLPQAVAPYEAMHLGDRFAQILDECTSAKPGKWRE